MARARAALQQAQTLLAGYGDDNQDRLVGRAGFDLDAEIDDLPKVRWGRVAFMSALGACGGLVVGWLALLVIPLSYLNEQRRRGAVLRQRRESFERDYPALLLSLASGVRTGLDPIVALQHSGALFAPGAQVRREVERFRETIEQGRREEVAIAGFARSLNLPDVRLFRAALVLSRREGASLGECLQRLAKVTRQRQSFRRKARAAVAMQRLSAFGIAGCAVAICALQMSAMPDAFSAALAHPVGSKVLLGGATLVVGGVVWMVRLARASV